MEIPKNLGTAFESSKYCTYYVNLKGEIRSYNSKLKTIKLRKPEKLKNGYHRYRILDKRTLGHRIVAEVYLKKESKKNKVVNHKDGNRSNNSVSNLEWCTDRFNILDSVDKGTHNKVKLNPKKIIEIRKLLKKGKTTVYIGKIYGVNPTSITHIKNGKTWKHVK